MLAVFTHTPRSPSSSGAVPSIALAARRSTLNVPIRFTRITVSKGSSACGPRLPAVFSAHAIPAQQMEIRSPSWPAACATAASTCAASVTSACTKLAPSSSAVAAPRSGLRSAIVTRAPASTSRRAVAAPRPDAPPATGAFTPSIRIRGNLAGAHGAAPRRAGAHHAVAAEPRAHPETAGLLRAQRGRVRAVALEAHVAPGHDALAGPGSEGQRARAALLGRHRLRQPHPAADLDPDAGTPGGERHRPRPELRHPHRAHGDR